jgi:hypothetical protein
MQRAGEEDVAAGDPLLLPTSAAILPLEGKDDDATGMMDRE